MFGPGLALDPRTRAYAQRRTAEENGKAEMIRPVRSVTSPARSTLTSARPPANARKSSWDGLTRILAAREPWPAFERLAPGLFGPTFNLLGRDLMSLSGFSSIWPRDLAFHVSLEAKRDSW